MVKDLFKKDLSIKQIDKNAYSFVAENLNAEIRTTGEGFTHEFDKVPDRENLHSKLAEDKTLFFLKTGIDKDFYSRNKTKINHHKLQEIDLFEYKGDFSFLKDKIVVDAGCGNGRFAKIVSPYCKHLICLDIGQHIFSTKERLSNFSNISYIQCNLSNIPLKDKSIDFIYSIGVIHHTPNPLSTLQELSRILKSNSRISIWVYPPEYWGNKMKRVVSQWIRKILLQFDLEKQVKLLKLILMPIGRLQMKIEKIGLKHLFAPFFIINVPRHSDYNEMLSTTMDYYLPQFIYTYTPEQLEEMFDRSGLTFKKLNFPTSGIGTKK